ncbi:MAG: hypothetical protein ACOC9J_01870 [Persicimonas sp.]
MFLVLGSWFLNLTTAHRGRDAKNQEPRTKNCHKASTSLICLLVFVMATLSGLQARAQETIFDPENPATEDPDEETDDPSDDGEETIFDPENPAAGEPVEDEPVEEPAEDEPEPVDRAFSDASFLGSYSTGLAVDTAWEGRGEDIVEWSSLLGLRVDYDMTRHSRVVIEGEFWHWMGGQENPDETDLLVNASNPRASYRARLGEAYVVYREGGWAFRAGNLVSRWGSTDIVRPGDVINPTDFTQLDAAAITNDMLLPQLTAEASYSGADWSVTGLVVPFFRENDVVVFGRDVAIANPFNPLIADQMPVFVALEELFHPSRYDDVQSIFTATRVPDETPENASFGARGTLTQWNTDFGLGYFFGWDRTPWTHLDEDVQELIRLAVDDGQVLDDLDFLGFVQRNPQAVEISGDLSQKADNGEELFFSEYRRRHTLVADMARYIGPIGVRADVAFSPEQTFYTRRFEPLRRSTVFGALGLSWERLRSEDDLLTVTLEGFWLHPFSRDNALNRAFVAADERGPRDAELLLVGTDLYGAAAAVNWRIPVIDAELQVGALGTLSNEDVVATASVSRRWHSWLRTTAGLTVYEGPDPADGQLSLGGLYDQNDQVTLTVDGVF